MFPVAVDAGSGCICPVSYAGLAASVCAALPVPAGVGAAGGEKYQKDSKKTAMKAAPPASVAYKVFLFILDSQ